ncbi:MAG: carboxylating nicotinate-nucleotide diphosphorylase [Bacteroidales bacterium]|nr:carboxylating nicotinate-nucleotide diphosphorylase [Bacteroidales bacterium]
MSLEELIQLALDEDLGNGDHTSRATIPLGVQGTSQLIAKEKGILSGIQVAEKVFHTVDATLRVKPLKTDGDPVLPGDVLMEITGSSLSMLSAERTALNFLQRMSGIATYTHSLVQKLQGLNTLLLDTRKTTALNRIVEKMAVTHGGGVNHRFGLYDMIMIKDNHIDFAGGVEQAIHRVRDYLTKNKLNLKIEIEARSFEELDQILKAGDVDRIMLDNFTPADLKKALAKIDGKYETEASGGITEDTLRAYAETGVDYISVGALTHRIKSLDISMKAAGDRQK